jgi:membrane protease subunit HflK
MAWNQPEGKKDPWGRRPDQRGPDLDQTVREWQRKIEALFRGGKTGGGGGAGAPASGSFAPLLIGLALVLWVVSGFYQVNAPERGVVQRFGKRVGTTTEGLHWHWPWPIERVTKVNVSEVNSVEYESRVLTADVNLVDLRVAVQYRKIDPELYLFSVRDLDSTLREVSESAIREVVGRSELNSILVGGTRQEITASTRQLIQNTLDSYRAGVGISSVNLTNVQVPEAVIPSQRDANKAIADQERLVREAQAYESGIIPVAEGQAARQVKEAEAYKLQVIALAQGESERFAQLVEAYRRSPEVTRQRLYIEAVESVLNRSRKVVVDSNNAGSNNIFYLPLDQLMGRGGVREGDTATRVQSPEPETVTVDATRTRGER